MSLEEALFKLAKKTIDSNNDWYSWKKIDETKLPFGIKLPEGNQYSKNVSLKLELNEKWLVATPAEKQILTTYYISSWGGIHTNSPEKLNLYANTNPDKIIELGKKGIASWSKALCVYEPE